MWNEQMRDAEEFLPTEFRDVDAAAVEKNGSIVCSSWIVYPHFSRYKSATIESDASSAAFDRSGPGLRARYDVDRLARLVAPDGAAGVDASSPLLKMAQSRVRKSGLVRFVKADIHALPFDDEFLYCCKVDLTLQDVEKPAEVVREMFRTVLLGWPFCMHRTGLAYFHHC